MDPLVDCEWLKNNLDAPNQILLDATFFLPNQPRNAHKEYQEEHLPGAGFFDIDLIADRTSCLPHMLPSELEFSQAVGALGINNRSTIIVYDNNSFMASARVWWTFRVFGHQSVAVLDGGLKRWKAQKLPLESGNVETSGVSYKGRYNPQLVRSLEEIRTVLTKDSVQIVDARSAGRFNGTEPEPRPELRKGHIPRSVNVPYSKLIDESTHKMLGAEELNVRFQKAGVEYKKPIVTTCGSGVTAAILALGLYTIGNHQTAIYDGSWAEWGSRDDTPIEAENNSSLS